MRIPSSQSVLAAVLGMLMAIAVYAQEPVIADEANHSVDPESAEGMGVGQQPSPVGLDPSSNASGASPQPMYRKALLLGLGVSQGESVPSTPGQSDGGAFIQASPRIELLIVSRKTHFTFAAAPVIAQNAQSGTFIGATGVFDPTIELSTRVSPRLTWIFRGGFEFGQEAARIYLNQSQSCNFATCGTHLARGLTALSLTDPGASTPSTPLPATSFEVAPTPSQNLAVQDLTAHFADVSVASGVEWRSSPTSIISAVGGESYSILNGYNIASARVQDSEAVSHLTVLQGYGQVHDYTFENSSCTSYGIGGGISRQLTRETMFHGEIGPEFGNRACGRRLGLDFNLDLRSRFNEHWTGYAVAARDLNAAYLRGNRWFDTFQLGAEWRALRHLYVDMSGAYFHSSGAPDGSATLSGYSLSPQLRWEVNPQLDFLASYRNYQSTISQRSGGSDQLNRGFLLFTLMWRPRTVHF